MQAVGGDSPSHSVPASAMETPPLVCTRTVSPPLDASLPARHTTGVGAGVGGGVSGVGGVGPGVGGAVWLKWLHQKVLLLPLLSKQQDRDRQPASPPVGWAGVVGQLTRCSGTTRRVRVRDHDLHDENRQAT